MQEASKYFHVEGPMTLRQVTLQTGLTVDTLRYYEKVGLLPPIARDPSSKQRRYSVEDVYRAHYLAALRASGMSMSDMKAYLDNETSRMSSIEKRMELLRKQQFIVKNKIARLNRQLAFLEKKEDHYAAAAKDDEVEMRRIELELIDLSKYLNREMRDPNIEQL